MTNALVLPVLFYPEVEYKNKELSEEFNWEILEKKQFSLYLNHVLETFLPYIVGRVTFREKAGKELLRDFVMSTDEAFLYLVLENNYDNWVQNATHHPDGLPEGVAPKNPKCTWGLACRNEGWSLAGLDKFNEFTKKVEHDRTTVVGLEFEKSFRHPKTKKDRTREKERVEQQGSFQ